METEAASAIPQRGYHPLKDTRLAAAETAPEPPGESSPADSSPLTDAKAKVKVEPCSASKLYESTQARRDGFSGRVQLQDSQQ